MSCRFNIQRWGILKGILSLQTLLKCQMNIFRKGYLRRRYGMVFYSTLIKEIKKEKVRGNDREKIRLLISEISIFHCTIYFWDFIFYFIWQNDNPPFFRSWNLGILLSWKTIRTFVWLPVLTRWVRVGEMLSILMMLFLNMVQIHFVYMKCSWVHLGRILTWIFDYSVSLTFSLFKHKERLKNIWSFLTWCFTTCLLLEIQKHGIQVVLKVSIDFWGELGGWLLVRL